MREACRVAGGLGFGDTVVGWWWQYGPARLDPVTTSRGASGHRITFTDGQQVVPLLHDHGELLAPARVHPDRVVPRPSGVHWGSVDLPPAGTPWRTILTPNPNRTVTQLITETTGPIIPLHLAWAPDEAHTLTYVVLWAPTVNHVALIHATPSPGQDCDWLTRLDTAFAEPTSWQATPVLTRTGDTYTLTPYQDLVSAAAPASLVHFERLVSDIVDNTSGFVGVPDGTLTTVLLGFLTGGAGLYAITNGDVDPDGPHESLTIMGAVPDEPAVTFTTDPDTQPGDLDSWGHDFLKPDRYPTCRAIWTSDPHGTRHDPYITVTTIITDDVTVWFARWITDTWLCLPEDTGWASAWDTPLVYQLTRAVWHPTLPGRLIALDLTIHHPDQPDQQLTITSPL